MSRGLKKKVFMGNEIFLFYIDMVLKSKEFLF